MLARYNDTNKFHNFYDKLFSKLILGAILHICKVLGECEAGYVCYFELNACCAVLLWTWIWTDASRYIPESSINLCNE